MRTSPPRSRKLRGFILLDGIMGVILFLLIAAGMYQSFSTMSVVVQKYEHRIEGLLEKKADGPLFPYL